MEKQNFIIIGGVAAGMSAASRIRNLNPNASILVFEKTGYVSYIACGMPYLIAGKVESSKSLVAYDEEFFRTKRNIDVFLHHEAVRIFPSRKTVLIRNILSGTEKEYTYYKLLVSTGARPLLPPIKGLDLKGIFTLRNLEDGVAIKDYISRRLSNHGIIAGAGYIGMEMAEAFRERDINVTVVEKMPTILGSMDDEITEVIETELLNHGVTLIKSRKIIGFEGRDSVARTVLDNGNSLQSDIVVISTGIKPNSEIAGDAGIELGRSGAIHVNNNMETNIPDIYAAGDCAEAFHLIYGRNSYIPLGTTANKQGRIAGTNMAGGSASFNGIVGTSTFKVFNLEVARTGITEKEAQHEGIDYVSNTIEQTSRAHYYPGASQIRVKLVADRHSHRLLGAQMVGKEGVSKRIDIFATAITSKMTVHDVENLDLGYAPPFAPVYDAVLIAARELQKKMIN